MVSGNGVKSILFHVISRVPQDLVLEPLLFLLYIKDMHLCVTDYFFCLYADDTPLGIDVAECALQKNTAASC